ncbi:MAG: hypothetical protein WD467_00425 [Candidatus Saccharimonadales bacterium]
MEFVARNRAPKLAVYLAAGSLALSGCSSGAGSAQPEAVPDFPGCELPDVKSELEIPNHNSRNPLQHEDLTQVNLNETLDQLSSFSEIESRYMEDSGITVRIYSEGDLLIDSDGLERLLLAAFEAPYEIPRLSATMECLRERLSAGEFAGHEIPILISSDPRKCINGLQLSRRAVNEMGARSSCHASGGSVPWRIKELSWLQDIIELQPRIHPIVIAPGSTALSDYPTHAEAGVLDVEQVPPPYIRNPNWILNSTIVHEFTHTLRWAAEAEYSLTQPNVEEDLVKHITSRTMTYLNSLEDFLLPVRYSCEALRDWEGQCDPAS